MTENQSESSTKDIDGNSIQAGRKYRVQADNGRTFYSDCFYDEAGSLVFRNMTDLTTNQVDALLGATWQRL